MVSCGVEILNPKHIYSSLPNDILLYILNFIEDIDIRRYFGLYKRLDIKKYDMLNYIILTPDYHPFNPSIIRYRMKNIISTDKRNGMENYNENDGIDLIIINTKNEVHYEMVNYRIKKKSKDRINSIHWAYDLGDSLFWDVQYSKYSR